MASGTEFQILLSFDFHVNSHTWLVVMVLGSVSEEKGQMGALGFSSNPKKSRNSLGFLDHLDQTPTKKQGSYYLAPDEAGTPPVLFTDLSLALRRCLSHSSCSKYMLNG